MAFSGTTDILGDFNIETGGKLIMSGGTTTTTFDDLVNNGVVKVEEWCMNSTTTTSDADRSLSIFPAGSNGEFNLPPELTMVIQRGEGCRLWDTRGNEYIDFSMGWGSALVGHARSEVIEAVKQQVRLGGNFAYVTEPSLTLAEQIAAVSPACEQLRFCASGTEATMCCLNLAIASSGKYKVLKFEGAYHGAHAVGVTSLFPQQMLPFPKPERTSAGVSPLVQDQVLVAPFNDADTAAHLIAENAKDLAAVIVEPLHRCLAPKQGFLQELRKATSANGVLLIFDEVVTGFRLALGGAQEYYGVVPDLVAYGKALGGGLPIGAFCGRQDIMSLVREDRLGRQGYVWSASTFGGNPISTAAAGAALAVYRQADTYKHLHQMGAYLRERMGRVLRDRSIPGHIIGDGPLAQVVFSAEPQPPHDYRSMNKADAKIGRAVMLALFKLGIFLNPIGTKLYLSLAHDQDVCDQFLIRFDDALEEVVLGRRC